MKIGDKIWEHWDMKGWREATITGETRVSWICGPSYALDKVNKKELAAGTLWGWKATRAEVDDVIWARENAWRIGQFITGIREPHLLRKVAELIGYTAPSLSVEESKEE